MTCTIETGALFKAAQSIESDTERLWFLDMAIARRLLTLAGRRRERQQFLQSIADCTEDGKVCLHTYGRDCDGGQINLFSPIEADAKEIDASINHALEWSDGPLHFRILSPSEAERAMSILADDPEDW